MIYVSEYTIYVAGWFSGLLFGIVSGAVGVLYYTLPKKESTTFPLSSDDESEPQDETHDKVSSEQNTHNKVARVEDDELVSMFDDEIQRQSRSREETLALGKSVGSEPVMGITTAGGKGGYLTNKQMEDVKSKRDNFKVLSRADELEIIHAFKKTVVDCNYYQALGRVQEQGYGLVPLYVYYGPKLVEGRAYDAAMLGVRISDPHFDYSNQKPSRNAVIAEIVDVGGIDKADRGVISKKQ